MKKFFAFTIGLLLFSQFSFAQAQEVDLLWQGETYTQPFYKGRALWSSQSRITVVAIPQGLGNSANLNYKWTKSGTVLGNINGVGKNSISFLDSVLSKPQTIKVEVLGENKEVLASASTYIVPARPVLAIYENNPLYGFLFNKEVGENYELRSSEVTFTAFPLFFSVLNRADETIGYQWKSNAGGTDTRNSVTYRSPEGTSGSARITAQATSKENILQSASKNFLIQFSDISNPGI